MHVYLRPQTDFQGKPFSKTSVSKQETICSASIWGCSQNTHLVEWGTAGGPNWHYT